MWVDYDKLPSELPSESANASTFIGCPVLLCSVHDVKIELAYIRGLSYVGKILARKSLRSFSVLTFAPFRCAATASSQPASQHAGG
jgi:hypothetical protein